MHLDRTPLSDTVTRYRVTAQLPPYAQLLLVRPQDGTAVIGWAATAAPLDVESECVSSHADLVLRVSTPSHEGPPAGA